MEHTRFTLQQLEQANQVDLEEFLLQHGEKLLRSGPEKRMASNHSTTIRGCEWFDHADRQGGKAVSFVQRYLGVSFREAVQILLGGQGIIYAPAQPRKEEPPKPFVLPSAHTDNRRVRAYLEHSRKISAEVLRTFEKEGLIYEDSQYHNAVFVGFDGEGVARHAHKRSTNTQGKQFKINVEGCNARYSFHWTGSSDRIYVFEAPIDMLSFLSMKAEWQRHSYVALCGVAEHALIQQLEDYPHLSDIVLCMDNDEAGIQARKRIKDVLQERGYAQVSSLLPSSKDWNEDLQRGIVMTEKVREYLTLSRETTMAITQDRAKWQAFLRTSGQMYKYSFNDQVLIFAQRPEATACASYDVWNKTMRRYVKRGAKGIALLDAQDQHLKLHYVFDVSDTSEGNRARKVHVWRTKEKQIPAVQKVLEDTFGVPTTIGNIQEQVMAIASILWMNKWTTQKDDVLGNIDDSIKKEYDEFTIQEMFRKAVVPSVMVAVCSRCGTEDPEITTSDFENISKFVSPKMVNILGDVVTGFSNEMLRTVERTVKQLEKDERSNSDGNRVQTSGRGPDSRSGTHGHRHNTHPAVGTDAPEVPAGSQAVYVLRHGDGADSVSTPSGDRPGSSGQDGHSDAAAGKGGGSHGGAEAEGPDEVGGADEHLPGPSGGNHSGGTDFQLSLFPTEAEQIQMIEEAESVADTSSAFFFAQDNIDHVLRLGGNTYRQRERIVVAFEEQKSTAEIAAYLQTLYTGGNGIGSITAWYAKDGIHLSYGKSARYAKSAQVISWESAAERIGQLLQEGQFATSVELAEADGYERTRLAEKLCHLYHDFSEEAREAGYLSCLAAPPQRGFPEQSAWFADQLKSPEFRQTLSQEYAAFWTAYRQDRKLMRFHYHKPKEIWEGLKDLSLPHTAFSSQMTEVPAVNQFITEDEIDAALAHGSNVAGGKGRIFSYFQEAHTDKEKADFLKHEYGIGGHSHALSGSYGSDESHDGKGIRYKKVGCPDVHITWEKVAKRITMLIQRGRYLTEQEQAEYDKIQAEKALADETAVAAAPTIRELHEKYKPIVLAAVMEDMAYRNACGHSDRENAVIEGNAAIRRAVIGADNMELLRLYSDMPEFRQRLHCEVIDETYPRLFEMLRPLSQDDIDDAICAWNGDVQSKYAVVRYMEEHGREKDTAAWLAHEYGGKDSKSLFVTRAGSPEEIELPWPKVQRRIAQLIRECRFLTEQERQTEPQSQEKRPYQVIVYHQIENGFDEKKEYPTLEEAEKVAKSYVDGTMEPDGFSYDGAAVYDMEARQYLRIYGDYPNEKAHEKLNELAQPRDLQAEVKTLDEVLDEHPISIQVNGEWQTFPNARAAEEAAYEEYKENLRRSAENFHITDDHLGQGGPKAKFQANIEAIKLLKYLEGTTGQATPEQQQVLSRYVGWGGLADAFDPEKPAWAAEYAQLKELLTQEEYAAARGSTLNAHYTSPVVIRAMYDAVGRMGFETGNILEPSCGVGNFFGMLPERMAGSKLYGVELDTLLDLGDDRGQSPANPAVTKSTQPSVLESLKRPTSPHISEKKPKQDLCL